MSFGDAAIESQERFAETLSVLNHLAAAGDHTLTLRPASEVDKALRGLWLVSLYGAFERSVNAAVEQALYEISSHNSPSSACLPSIYSIFHHPLIQSVKDCSYRSVFEKSSILFETAMNDGPIKISENPLSEMLQNVDCKTLVSVARYFGGPEYKCDPQNAGRLNSLRERRNAVAHGRESASQVGQRYSYQEMRKLYEVADLESTRFLLHMKEYCTAKKYIRQNKPSGSSEKATAA